MAELQEGWVRIVSPANGLVHECPKEAYDEVWKDKGFKLEKAASEAKEAGK